jgi:phosphinothricin acetyltransferase
VRHDDVHEPRSRLTSSVNVLRIPTHRFETSRDARGVTVNVAAGLERDGHPAAEAGAGRRFAFTRGRGDSEADARAIGISVGPDVRSCFIMIVRLSLRSADATAARSPPRDRRRIRNPGVTGEPRPSATIVPVREAIRRADEGDLEQINAIYNHYVDTSHATFDLAPTDMEYRRDWFAERRNALHFVLVADGGGEIRGYATTGRYRPRAAYDTTVETSVYVGEAFQGRGLGRELYRALLEAVDSTGAHRAVAGIALPNPASERLHLRFGFRRVGRFSEQGYKFGRFWDVDWYERNVPLRLEPDSP